VSSHAVTVWGFALLIGVALGMQLVARSQRSRLPTLRDVFTAIGGRTGGKLALFAVWCWFGWHFLAR
jgi:Family of unknown function (DUF6186)